MMRPVKHILPLIALLATSTARAEDTAALLTRADQAFTAAEYSVALDLYKKLEPKITDKSQLAMMQERMRFATRQLAAAESEAPSATQPAPAAAEPATQPAAERKKHVRPKDGEVFETTLHDLGNFELQNNDPAGIPDDVMALSGSKIRITGQMLPIDQVGRVNRFLLVNDLMSCCFGAVPKLQNTMYISLPEGSTMAPTSERIVLEGTLKVTVRKEEGYVLGIFELVPSSVKYAPQ
jgi:hypothetical protein